MKFLTIDLYTDDLIGTRQFYAKQLELDIITKSADYLMFQVGWTRLTFWAVTKPVAPYHFAINVPASKLQVCMNSYQLDYLDTQSAGQTIAEFPNWRARSCYFYDNNGNLLEFIDRSDLTPDTPNLTVDDLFQGISEIAIVTENVAQTARQLTQRFGVMQFSKSTPMPDFNALGDDNGLFILSQSGRNWLFTEIPSALTYCQVTFETGPGGRVQTVSSYEVNQMPIGYANNDRY